MSVEVKICGLTNRDDAQAALDLGADYLGFVLYSRSPRGISSNKLSVIIDALPSGIKSVGVFVNESRAKVEKIASDCGLYAVQIHGDEPAGDFADFPCRVWRAVKHVSGLWKPLPETWNAERYVVDSSIAGLYGGTGVIADWKVSAGFVKEHPAMLSGGLTPENVADAIRATRPLGVDVASGVEAAPGKKDAGKLREFIQNARTVKI